MSNRVVIAEEELSAQASEVSIWRSFMEHPGWKKMEEILNGQHTTRVFMVALSPLESLSKVPAQEFMKGEANAFGAVMKLPATMLEQAQHALKMSEVKLSQEKENVQAEASARGGSRVVDDNFSRE